MCGIVGLVMWPLENENNKDARDTFAKLAFTSLLEITQSRGTDATGVAIHLQSGDWKGLKSSYKAEDFIKLDPTDSKIKEVASASCYEGGDTTKELVPAHSAFVPFMNTYWTENTEKVRAVLGHCRKATEGPPDNLLNNHPLQVGKIIGIHNGGVKNADEVFKKHKDDFLPRIAQVDSEAIFQLMNFFHPAEEAGTVDYLQEVAGRLEMHAAQGGSAVVAFHQDFPGILYAFCKSSRPLVFAFSAPLGLLFIISEVEFIKGITLFAKAHSYFNNDFPDPEFEFKPSPVNEAYIIDAREPLGDKTKLEQVLKHIDISKMIKGYETPVTYSHGSTYDHQTGRWNQGVQNAYTDNAVSTPSKPITEEAKKFIPITTERYNAKTNPNIVEIPPKAKLNETTKTESAASGVSVYEEVIKYISSKTWWKFQALFTKNERDPIFNQIRVMIKEAYGRGISHDIAQVKSLTNTLRYLLLCRVESLEGLRNIIELIDQNTLLPKDKLLTLLNFQTQTDLENEWSKRNSEELQNNTSTV